MFMFSSNVKEGALQKSQYFVRAFVKCDLLHCIMLTSICHSVFLNYILKTEEEKMLKKIRIHTILQRA